MSSPDADRKTAPKAPGTRRAPQLPGYLALAYSLLIGYASLHPLSGWRDPGLSLLTFVDAPWPRYWTFFDLAANVIAYLPLGFLLTLTLHRLRWRWLAVVLVILLGGGLSFALECLQTFLPSRVAANLDIASNTLGALLGALFAARYSRPFLGWLGDSQRRLLSPLPHAEVGLVLVALWLLTQLSPETILFGAGDLRYLLSIASADHYEASEFFAVETGIIVCNLIAAGLIARTLLARVRPPYAELGVLFAVALSIRTLAAAILVDPPHALAWLTPGAGLGLMIGGGVLSVLLLLPVWLRNIVAGLALMAGTVLVNLTPPNPYSAIALEAWRQGHFLNFNGLTRLTASLWPFLALPYLTISARRL